LIKYAYPELDSSTGALRAWASWVFGEYADLLLNVEFKVSVAVKVYENLLVQDLPIWVTAATSLYKLLSLEEVKAWLKDGLVNIIKSYLDVMKEIDQEELITALE